MTAHLRAQGRDVLWCDLTTSDIARFGVHVARVLVPNFQPLHFGRAQRRLGGTRLYTFPRSLGFRETDETLEDLNDDPHPLA